MKSVLIIGGGITGLAAAHRLLELSHANNEPLRIILAEAAPRLGGIVHTEQRDGFLIERGPDSFISEKPEALALVRRLGIESRLLETNEKFRRSFIVRNGKLRVVPEGFQLLAPSRLWPFISTDIFSVAGKLRMAADLLLPRKTGLPDESLASFVRRRLGREALERMAQPMVGGIYTADPETLSLRATLPRFLEMEQAHRSVILAMWKKVRLSGATSKANSGVSGARYSLFLAFDQGVQVIVDELEKVIRAYTHSANDTLMDIRLNTRVEKLRRSGGSWVAATGAAGQIEVDAVCISVPAHTAAGLVSEIDPQLSAQLSGMRYASTATVNLAYRRSNILHALNGFGFVVPFAEKRSLIACTFSSVKFSGRAPEGQALLRAFVGGALQPEMFALSDDQMLARVETDLRELLGIKARPLFAEISRWSNSMPQYEVGHLERVSEMEDRVRIIPHLTLAGNSYRGAGLPDCIRSGETAAEEMMKGLNLIAR